MACPCQFGAKTAPSEETVSKVMKQCVSGVDCLSVSCRVESIYPVHDPVALQDGRLCGLIQYAMMVSLLCVS